MDVDPAPPAQQASESQKENMPGSFNESANGVNGNTDKMDVDDEAPVPPPHKSAPASPVEKQVTPEEAEAFKNQGNVHFKAREYGKAIAEYTKGT